MYKIGQFFNKYILYVVLKLGAMYLNYINRYNEIALNAIHDSFQNVNHHIFPNNNRDDLEYALSFFLCYEQY